MERDLTAPMFRFAAAMPALTRLIGLDEFGDDGPMPPAEVDQVRAMLPHISMDWPARHRQHPVRPATPRAAASAVTQVRTKSTQLG